MAAEGVTKLRRTWPQRLLILFNCAVIVASLYAAWSLDDVSDAVAGIPRVEFPLGVLVDEDTPYGSPLNFLLVGSDSGDGLDPDDPAAERPDTNHSDVIILLRVDPTAQQAWLVSIPRDLIVEIPGFSEQKINAAYTLGGEPLLVQTVTEVFDVDIDHFISIDFAGFASVVDQIGGVDVNFVNPTRDDEVGLFVPVAGCYRLDGEEALKYVRSRAGYREDTDGDGDFESVDNRSDLNRIRRQQDFMILALERAVDRGITVDSRSISDTIGAASKAIRLDNRISIAELRELAGQFADFDPDNLTRYNLDVYDDDFGGSRELFLGDTPANDAVMDVFRGKKSVSVVLESGPGMELGAANLGSALAENGGFTVAGPEPTSEDLDRTTVRYSSDRVSDAIELLRHLDDVDVEIVAESGVLTLTVADDGGVFRFVPRNPDDVIDDLPEEPLAADLEASATTVPTTTTAAERSATSAQAGPTTTVVTTTTAAVTGKPPEGADCSQRLGSS